MSSSLARAIIRRDMSTSYRNGRLVVKWDLESGLAMKGNVSRRLLDAIKELEAEGRL